MPGDPDLAAFIKVPTRYKTGRSSPRVTEAERQKIIELYTRRAGDRALRAHQASGAGTGQRAHRFRGPVFVALMAVSRDRPGGQVLPVAALRARVTATVDAHCRCDRSGEVGTALPALIRDLHTSIAAGRDVAELLDLAVLLHCNATVGWLRVAGASLELRELAAGLASRAAEDRDTPDARGLAVYAGLYVLATAGAVDLARADLDSVSVPTRTPQGMQLAGVLAGPHDPRRPGEVPAGGRRDEHDAPLADRARGACP